MSFDSLGLSTEILRAIAEQNYHEPTPIQLKAIPVVLSGKDLMAGAQTGTGKTAGFTLPMLQILSSSTGRGRRPLRALVLTPTRELAAQVSESIQTYGKYLPLRSTVIYGGVNINPQIKAIRAGLDILVATPGRLLDHVSQGTLDLSKIEILVLDEADRMLDMGFIHDIKRILALLPTRRQNLLFSATFSEDIKNLANRLLNNPVSVSAAHNTAATGVDQLIHPVDRERKRELLSYLIKVGRWQQVLIFTRTKHGANRLSQQLERDGISSAAIHGNKSQGARTKALAGFKSGDVRALVATDIAARGIDIDKLPHVVNYELPHVAEDYVHRIGRTGRAGRDGSAVSLVCVDEHKLLEGIERLLKTKIDKEVITGFEPDPRAIAEPIPNGRNRMATGNNGRSGPSRRVAGSTSSNPGRSRGGQQDRDYSSGGSSKKPQSRRRGMSGPTTNR